MIALSNLRDAIFSLYFLDYLAQSYGLYLYERFPSLGISFHYICSEIFLKATEPIEINFDMIDSVGI